MKWVARILIAAFLAVPALAGAQAQNPIKLPKGIKLPIDPLKLNQTTTDASGNPVVSLLSKPMTDLANFISKGFGDATDLSTAVPELQDGNGQACWSMMQNYSLIIKKHPIPVTLEAAADLESIRLLNMAANKICQNSACTQVFTDAGNLVNAASPIAIALPNLTALCSKVPEIAVVAPTPIPTPTPTPSPSPTPTAAPQ